MAELKEKAKSVWIFFVSYYNLVSPAAKDAEITEYAICDFFYCLS